MADRRVKLKNGLIEKLTSVKREVLDDKEDIGERHELVARTVVICTQSVLHT